MDKVIEKILERLEEEREYSYADFDKYVSEYSPCLDSEYDDFFHRGLERASRLVKEAAKEYNDNWIPCSERYPDNDNYILLSFENFSVPCVGRYEQDKNGGAFYVGDEDKSCVSQDMFVNAWMPLPERYKKSKQINETNVVKWHPFKDYEYLVLSEPLENKVIIMGINTDYVGYAPIDELECTGQTAKINIIMEGDINE